jgi:hypothetical protein
MRVYTYLDMDKYLITIDETSDEGLTMIAFTKRPAIKAKGLAFNLSEKKQSFSIDEKLKRVVAPAMIPMDIYRYDSEDDYEYEVRFTEEVIEKCRTKLMKDLVNRNLFNLEHSDIEVPAFILETWIIGRDPKADKAYSEYGMELPSGTLMVMSQITDDKFYEEIVKNEQFAYSVEGFFGLDELKFQLNKNKEKQMEKENKFENFFGLPNGEHIIGGRKYIVVDLEDEKEEELEDKEEDLEEDKKEDLEEDKKEDLEEDKKEDLEEDKKEEELEDKEDEQKYITEEEVLSIIQPKLDELISMIADVKAMIPTIEEEEELSAPVKLSVEQKFSEIVSFLKK